MKTHKKETKTNTDKKRKQTKMKTNTKTKGDKKLKQTKMKTAKNENERRQTKTDPKRTKNGQKCFCLLFVCFRFCLLSKNESRQKRK